MYKLVGKENARAEIISYIIEKGKNLIWTTTIEELLLPEGIFLIVMITEQATREQLRILLNKNFVWNQVWELLAKIEKITLKKYTLNILTSLIEVNSDQIDNGFHNKLVNKAIEDEIAQLVRNEHIHRDMVLSNIQNHPIISKVQQNRKKLLSNSNINKRIDILLGKKLIKYWHHAPKVLRPSKKLSLRIGRTDEIYSIERMEKILRVVFEELRLDNFDYDFDSIRDIMVKVQPHLEGRRTRAIAAGILYYFIIINGIPRTNEEISSRVGVNPVTTGKLYREL